MTDEATANASDEITETTGAIPNGGERPADAPSPAADTSRAVAVVERQRIVATSDVAIWDTAAFDHMGRVGALMAAANLASPTIYDGTDAIGVKSRMVMIANLARECGANPLMFLQGCSIISNKLHLEGKVVNAIIRARTGIALKFRFGVWNGEEIEFPDDQQDAAFFRGAGDKLAVRVFNPDAPEDFVDGFVALWRTTRKGNPWENPANWRRQLRYRGAPEWARAFEPGAILGFYSDADEDLDEIGARPQRQPRDLRGKLGAGNVAAEGEGPKGFDAAHVEKALSGEETHEGDVQDGEFEDVGATGGDDAAATAEAAQRVQASRDAGETVQLGHAATGETYLFAGDAHNAEGKRLTYRDGMRFSTATVKGAAKFKVYGVHAPEVAEEEPADPTAGTASRTDNAPSAESGPATSGSAPPASDASPEAAASSTGGSGEAAEDEDDGIQEPCEYCGAAAGVECAEDCPGPPESAEDGAEPQIRQNPEDRQETAGEAQPPASEAGAKPEAETGFLATLRPMTAWKDIKAASAAMMGTSDWVSAPEIERDEVRRAIWAEVERIRRDHGDKVDQATDVSAFGMWLATIGNSRDDADAVEGTLNTLKREPVWGKLTEAQQATVQGRVDAKLKAIRG